MNSFFKVFRKNTNIFNINFTSGFSKSFCSSKLSKIETFSDAHFNEKPFIKRKRDKLKFDNSELGKGDARVQKIADVFSSPLILKSRKDN